MSSDFDDSVLKETTKRRSILLWMDGKSMNFWLSKCIHRKDFFFCPLDVSLTNSSSFTASFMTSNSVIAIVTVI